MSNIIPRETVELCRNCFDGRTKEALDAQLRLLPFIRSLFAETNPAPIKYAMKLRNLCRSDVRLPLYEPRDSTKELIKTELSKISELN